LKRDKSDSGFTKNNTQKSSFIIQRKAEANYQKNKPLNSEPQSFFSKLWSAIRAEPEGSREENERRLAALDKILSYPIEQECNHLEEFMADLQKQFVEFDDKIRLQDTKRSELAQKRKNILDTLSAGIKRQREEGKNIPSYRPFNQGSYDIFTSIEPLDGDYDLDVGIEFDLAKADYKDPLEVKRWVFDAVDGHTENVEMKEPCITVSYTRQGETKFHVDLPVYSKASRNPDNKCYLARGKDTTAKSERIWEATAPEKLTDLLNEKWSDADERCQYRQVIRAMKRWKNVNFSSEGNAAPRGITLAVAAYYWFYPSSHWVDGKKKFDNLSALESFVAAFKNQFIQKYDLNNKPYNCVTVQCPAEPFDDLCGRMSAEQMRQFYNKLDDLLTALKSAKQDPDPHTASKTLRRQFGDDFPVPEKTETAKSKPPAITHSGNSGR
jgi:hypothetical protein